MKTEKLFKTKTTYPSGTEVIRYFTETAFKSLCKNVGYIKADYENEIYSVETDFGFNFLEILEELEVITEW